jgi:hypothetical protein
MIKMRFTGKRFWFYPKNSWDRETWLGALSYVTAKEKEKGEGINTERETGSGKVDFEKKNEGTGEKDLAPPSSSNTKSPVHEPSTGRMDTTDDHHDGLGAPAAAEGKREEGGNPSPEKSVSKDDASSSPAATRAHRSATLFHASEHSHQPRIGRSRGMSQHSSTWIREKEEKMEREIAKAVLSMEGYPAGVHV